MFSDILSFFIPRLSSYQAVASIFCTLRRIKILLELNLNFELMTFNSIYHSGREYAPRRY